MTALAEQQSELLAALFEPWASVEANLTIALQQAWPQAQYLRGLQAYRSNAAVMSQSVLLSAYPQTARLMGAEQFEGLAVHLWRTQPPTRGDLAQWGEGLADFLRSIPELMAHEAYLPDLAELEWALHAGKTAADVESSEPAPLAVIDSEFPIIELQNGKEWAGVSDQPGQRALVFRQGFKTACISIPKDIDL
jgi:Putative DNA-binding domain